jgi:hypothetical protein
MLVAPHALAYYAKSFIKFDSKDSLWLLPLIFPPKFNLAKIFFFIGSVLGRIFTTSFSS